MICHTMKRGCALERMWESNTFAHFHIQSHPRITPERIPISASHCCCRAWPRASRWILCESSCFLNSLGSHPKSAKNLYAYGPSGWDQDREVIYSPQSQHGTSRNPKFYTLNGFSSNDLNSHTPLKLSGHQLTSLLCLWFSRTWLPLSSSV